jgi:hypothetical protein
MIPDHGPGTITWLMLAILAVIAAALYGCGCATPTPTRADRYPVPVMLDPVTERTPDVKIR